MKNILSRCLKIAGLLSVSLAMSSITSFAQSGDKTISGEVLDMSCYMAKGAHGMDHKDCASSCIKGGSPMGLLTSDGKVYLLVENHDKKDAYAEAKKHAGEQVTVSGTVSEKGGLQGIVVNEVKAKS
ncbi:hypothetical protein QTN47_27520 [Danxiaibacter flavus]|uniref:Uncharacterized protein n=1 Tax=Danxiaibacter flavus TaxID=3049108 RepID=A0ABV3ZP12_9BACT|nr:hypothetical protein QNM32_27520 [Chitinophagaceae bacterium DXS]